MDYGKERINEINGNEKENRTGWELWCVLKFLNEIERQAIYVVYVYMHKRVWCVRACE